MAAVELALVPDRACDDEGEMWRDARGGAAKCTARCGEMHGEIRRDARGDAREIAPLMVGGDVARYTGRYAEMNGEIHGRSRL